jgi:antitoxin YefM
MGTVLAGRNRLGRTLRDVYSAGPDEVAERRRGRERHPTTPLHTAFSAADENFAELHRQVVENREIVVIHREGHGDVALVCMDELGRLLEAAYVLRSPAEASRLLGRLREAMDALEARHP